MTNDEGVEVKTVMVPSIGGDAVVVAADGKLDNGFGANGVDYPETPGMGVNGSGYPSGTDFGVASNPLR